MNQILTQIKLIIQTTPNDADLGAKIRKLLNKL